MTCDEVKKQPPLARAGNESVQYFTDFERYGTPAKGKTDFYTMWRNRDFFLKKGFINRLYQHTKKQRGNQEGRTTIQRELAIWKPIAGVYFSTPQIFKPLLAMDYICRFKPKVALLDPTMGWGGRLIGACALDVPHYIGIELNQNLKQPYAEMVAMVRPFTKTKITLKFMDCLKVDYSQLKYDMVLTSPPYYNIEIYEGTTRKSKDDWDREFYYPFFEKTYGGLMNGGHYCMNIPIEVYDRVAKPMLGKADILVPLNKVVRQKGGGETYKEYMYVWVKKAGWKPLIPPPKAEIEGGGMKEDIKKYEAIFKQYPEVFPSGYFRYLKIRLQKHIENKTLIYKNGVILTFVVYQKSQKKTPKITIQKGDVKLDQIVNKNQGNGAAKGVVEEWLKKYEDKRVWLEVRSDNKRAIGFYKDRGFKKMDDISFGKDLSGIIMLREPR